MAKNTALVAPAQEGQLLSDVLAGQAAGQARPVAGAMRRAASAELDGGDRLRIVDTLMAVIQGAYCHLVQKRSGFAVDPVQALQLLRLRVTAMSESAFHLAITSIVTGLRDAHTRYSGPRSLQGIVATLPFLVEQYGPVDQPQFIVSKVSNPALVGDDAFQPGVTLESWNGIPFARAVDLHAERETGGRPDARLARALETLTSRSLELGPPPDEQWVIVGYRAGGRLREVRIPWRGVSPKRSPEGHRPGSRASRVMAIDQSAEQVRRARKLMFSYDVWKDEGKALVARGPKWLPTKMQDVLSARSLTINGESFGYLRIWSFDIEDDDAFLAELIRLLGLLPDSGLVIDLRGNPGGLIWAAERALQLFSPGWISPTRFSLMATPMTRAMARSPFNRLELEAWAPSLEAALSTGDLYSQPLPITDPAWCNDIGQKYSGPVACVVDANTYSSGDLFTAGFTDNNIGPVITVGEATGAGGANVWTGTDLRDALADTPFVVDLLPDGVDYSMAIRRATRSGASEGLPIEDVGVRGLPYAMTLNDLLHENEDLLEFCAVQFKGADKTAMKVRVSRSGIEVETRGLSSLEIYRDGIPIAPAQPVVDGVHVFKRIGGNGLELVGRKASEVRQRRRI